MGLVDPRGNLHVELDAKHCNPQGEDLARMQETLDALSRVVERFPVADLYVTLIHHPRSGDYHVKTSVILPKRTLFTGDRDDTVYAAYERCIGKLVRKVEAYKSGMSGEEERSKQEKGTHQDVVATRPVELEDLAADVDAGDYLGFRRKMDVYEEPLRKRVGRWIQRYPNLDSLVGEALDIADVVEEVFLVAYERFDEQPVNVSLGDWLENLIDPSIKMLAKHPDEEFENIGYIRTLRETETGTP